MQNVKSISFLKAQTQLLRYKLSKRYFTQIFRPTHNDEDDFEAHFDIFSKFLSDNFENGKSEQYETFLRHHFNSPLLQPLTQKMIEEKIRDFSKKEGKDCPSYHPQNGCFTTVKGQIFYSL